MRITLFSILITILISNPTAFGNVHSKNRTWIQSQNKTKSIDQILPRRLTEGMVEIIFLNVSENRWRLPYHDDLGKKFIVHRFVVTSRNPRVARILNSSLLAESLIPQLEAEPDDSPVSALSVKISGRRVGRTVIDIQAYGYPDNPNISTQSPLGEDSLLGELRFVTSFDVCVLRRQVYNKLNSAFTIFVAIITVCTTFLIGTQLDWKIIVRELRRPASLLIGIGLEFIIMPLVAFGLALVILRGNYGWQLSLLAIGAAPGGGHSPFWTMMLDGNLDLAVAMSFVASVAALGVLPFWLFTLGRVFYGGRVNIPYLTITGSLFGLVCPIFFGLAFKHFCPAWADRIGRILKPITVVSFIVVGIFGIAVNSYVFALLEWQHFLCGMLLPYAGFVITYPLSRWIFRRTHADSLAIAVENGCLNVAVPVVLIQLTLTQPDADLSLVVPVGLVICSSWPLWIYFIYMTVKKRFTKPLPTSDDDDETSGKDLNKHVTTITVLEKDSSVIGNPTSV